MTTGKQISARPATLAADGRMAARFTELPSKPPPRTLAELGETEVMLLRSLRHWLAGFQHQDHLGLVDGLERLGRQPRRRTGPGSR